MPEQTQIDLSRPYLVIPKLIEQPTWGGTYIAEAKQWQSRPELRERKIGQSYELFSGSNLSLCTSSDDPEFVGELTDRDAVQQTTMVPNAIPLRQLIEASPEAVLGAGIVEERGANLNLLLKFTQALGNSFQVHLKDGDTDPHWKPKLETWYYFEPGLLTLGIKKGTDWQAYQTAVSAVDAGMREIGQRIQAGRLTYEAAKPQIQSLLRQYDPWQFVNILETKKGELIDLSGGGIHHSWEEDTEHLPLGNVLYEVQNEALDDVSTLRSFDKGKIGVDGSLRSVHIADYFRLIDRSPETNDPATHIRRPVTLGHGEAYTLERLIKTKYYSLDKLALTRNGAEYSGQLSQFNHLFVQSGRVTIATTTGKVEVGAGHACFLPAAAEKYVVHCESLSTEILITS